MLFPHIHITFLLFILFCVFLLDHNKIQKFSALDIVESQSKEMWWVRWHNSTNFFHLMFNICFLMKLRIIYIILLTDGPDIILTTARTTKYEVAFSLMYYIFFAWLDTSSYY